MKREISKKIQERIAKYAKIMNKIHPDIREDCLLEAYSEADIKTRALYRKQMETALDPTPTDGR